jgi:hypothetical protein
MALVSRSARREASRIWSMWSTWSFLGGPIFKTSSPRRWFSEQAALIL